MECPPVVQLEQRLQQQPQEVDLEVGMPVVIAGLTSSPELNGMSGYILGLDGRSGRFMVEIEGVGSKRIKGSNLLYDEDCEFDEDDGEGCEHSECSVSGRSDHFKSKFQGSLTAPACP